MDAWDWRKLYFFGLSSYPALVYHANCSTKGLCELVEE